MNTAVFKKTVSKLDGQLDKLLEVAQSTGTQQDIVEEIKALKEKNQSENFKVLVMGEFRSGKSTMINALIGEPILPKGLKPTTAIITEIKYGADKKAVIYPKKGGWKGGDAPFEVPVTELKNYLAINHNNGEADGEYANTKAGNVIASLFERAEVFVPLDILKDGVEIIDSPGLNDPASHDDITYKYLPNVHAIIYCVNGTQPYTQCEKGVIEDLILKRYKTPMFLVTRYDTLCQENNAEELEIFRDTLTADLAKHTDLAKPEYTSMLDGNGIFFVSSRDALQAKRSSPWNIELLKESGHQDFERYLSDYLIKCKGDAQFRMIVDGIRTVGNDVIKSLNEEYNAADLALEEFEQRIKDAEGRMVFVKAQADLLVEIFESELEEAITDLKSTYEAFLEEAYYQVDTWRSTYRCSVKKEVFHPERTVMAIAEEFAAHMKRLYESFTVDWTENVLKPEVTRKMKEMGEKLKKRDKNFDETLNDIKVRLFDETLNDIKVRLNLTHASTDDDISTCTQFRCPVHVHPVYGWLIFYEIAQILIISGSNRGVIEKKVCNKIVEEFKRRLSDPNEVDAIVNNIHNKLKTEFAKLSEEAKKSAYADVKQIECETKQLLDDKKKGEEAVKARKAKITTWIAEVNTIIDTADKIRTEALA